MQVELNEGQGLPAVMLGFYYLTICLPCGVEHVGLQPDAASRIRCHLTGRSRAFLPNTRYFSRSR